MHDVIVGSFCYVSFDFGSSYCPIISNSQSVLWAARPCRLVLSSGWFMLVYLCLNVSAYIFLFIWFVGIRVNCRITISDFNTYLACCNNHLLFVPCIFTRCCICTWTEMHDTKRDRLTRKSQRNNTRTFLEKLRECQLQKSDSARCRGFHSGGFEAFSLVVYNAV
jgi:hypothetical protein